jgi:hypothetical protein
MMGIIKMFFGFYGTQFSLITHFVILFSTELPYTEGLL